MRESKPKFPHIVCSDGVARPRVANDIFTLGGFPCQLTWTPAMSPEEVEDFESWLENVKRRQRRWAAAYQEYLRGQQPCEKPPEALANGASE